MVTIIMASRENGLISNTVKARERRVSLQGEFINSLTFCNADQVFFSKQTERKLSSCFKIVCNYYTSKDIKQDKQKNINQF